MIPLLLTFNYPLLAILLLLLRLAITIFLLVFLLISPSRKLVFLLFHLLFLIAVLTYLSSPLL